MESKKSLWLQIVKYFIAGLAVINLVVLFLHPSGFLFSTTTTDGSDGSDSSGSDAAAPLDTPAETSPDAENSQYTIALQSDTFSYDGSGKLDLLDGVSLIDPDGKTSDKTIFVRIKTGDTISQKIVEYTADTESGRVSATRTLNLNNYSGPQLRLPDALPTIEYSELDAVLDVLLEDEDFYADDGYGNDITSSVTASYTVEEENPYIAHYVFTVSNSFNDSVTVSADINIEPRPIITLTDSEVTVPLNASFSALSYVADAVDTDGSSLMTKIIIDGQVDTSVAGEYILTYTLRSPSGMTSNAAQLKVIVE